MKLSGSRTKKIEKIDNTQITLNKNLGQHVDLPQISDNSAHEIANALARHSVEIGLPKHF